MDSAAELEAARASSAGWHWRPLSPRAPTAAATGPAQIRRPPLWPRAEEAGRRSTAAAELEPGRPSLEQGRTSGRRAEAAAHARTRGARPPARGGAAHGGSRGGGAALACPHAAAWRSPGVRERRSEREREG